ncbi:MAG: TnpV protein [Lachnospiraceae bacterium]|nr:TnpV protein [Lachnospiraceae bacterium]
MFIEQMKAGAGITEELKASAQMNWGRLINNIQHCADEIVLKELIYM